jgi:hypothetical protein
MRLGINCKFVIEFRFAQGGFAPSKKNADFEMKTPRQMNWRQVFVIPHGSDYELRRPSKFSPTQAPVPRRATNCAVLYQQFHPNFIRVQWIPPQ